MAGVEIEALEKTDIDGEWLAALKSGIYTGCGATRR